MLIVFTGLPGAGKSYLAERLVEILDADFLNRDVIRNAIFPSRHLDYTAEQNELASQVTYRVAEYILHRHPDRIVILDGRPFSEHAQVKVVQELAHQVGHELRVIYCWAPDEVVRQRLEQDPQRMQAGDRTMEKYLRIKARFEPLVVDHLAVNTIEPVDQLAQAVLHYIGLQPAE